MLDMAWKFLNIGKANAEIERLEKSLTDEQAKTAAVTKERDDAKAAIDSNNADIVANAEQVSKELTQAKADLIAAQASISTLTTERDSLKATIADPKGAIQSAAALKAAEITAAQGQPPIAAAGQTVPATSASQIRAEYDKMEDPAKRVAFYRANKSAIDASFKQ